jgi:hypothetical protein
VIVDVNAVRMDEIIEVRKVSGVRRCEELLRSFDECSDVDDSFAGVDGVVGSPF